MGRVSFVRKRFVCSREEGEGEGEGEGRGKKEKGEGVEKEREKREKERFIQMGRRFVFETLDLALPFSNFLFFAPLKTRIKPGMEKS